MAKRKVGARQAARRFSEPVQLQPQNMDTGAAQGIMNLANRLDQFASTIKAESTRAGARVGAREGAAAELGTTQVDGREITAAPKRREASLLDIIATGGERTSAYNKAVGSSYIASLSNDNRQALADIELTNPDDMAAYNIKVSGYRKGVMENVDPVLRGAVNQQLDDLHTSGQIRVNQRAVERQIEIADINRAKAIEGSTDAAIRLARDGDQIGAAEALLETRAVLNSYVGQPGYDQAAANFAFDQIQKTVAAENMFSAVTREAEKPGGIPKAVQAIRQLRDATNLKGFTVKEQDAMVATLISNLNQVISLKNKEEDQEKATVTQLQKERSGQLFTEITVGRSSAGEILTSLASNQITFTQANTLMGVVNNRGAGFDDFTLINEIETRIVNNEDIDSIIEDITNNTGVRLTEGTARGLISDLRDSKDKASPLTTSDSKAAMSFVKNMTVKVGALGAIDFDAQKRLAGLNREFRESVLAGENPWTVADRLVNASNEIEDIFLIYGDVSDTQGALMELEQAALSGAINGPTYNVEFEKIKRAESLQKNLTSFTKAKKAAMGREQDGE